MALPLYLAMTALEMSSIAEIPQYSAWMACHFSPSSQGLTNLPAALPEGAVLILDDRLPCQGHSPDLAAGQLREAVERLGCKEVLLDFQRPPEAESLAIVKAILAALPCPAAVSEGYARELSCPVFLPPCPLHASLEEFLAPWSEREVWLEAALCQEDVIVQPEGITYVPQFPPAYLGDGFYDEALCCHYRTTVNESEVRFTLFDTRESLTRKLEKARSLGVSKAVGLYQELG